MNIFKIKEMTEEKALRMEKDLTERLESLKEHQKITLMFGGFNESDSDRIEQIKELEKELHILNTEYAEYLI